MDGNSPFMKGANIWIFASGSISLSSAYCGVDYNYDDIGKYKLFTEQEN